MNKKKLTQNKVMTAQEVSQYLKLPQTTVYHMVTTGKLHAVKCGRQWRFMEPDVMDYLNGTHSPPLTLQESATENRKYPRMKTKIDARLKDLLVEDQEMSREGTLRDISEGGALFSGADCLLEVGHPVRLIFTIPGDLQEPLNVEGRIVHRSDNGNGSLGIKFRHLSRSCQEVICDYVG